MCVYVQSLFPCDVIFFFSFVFQSKAGPRKFGFQAADVGELPEYIPLKRARSKTDAPHKPLKRLLDPDRERKWSFPLSLLHRKHSKPEKLPDSNTSSMTSLVDTKSLNDYPLPAAPVGSQVSTGR